MHTHDGRADVLAGGDYEGKGQEHHDCGTIVQSEHATVRVEPADFH